MILTKGTEFMGRIIFVTAHGVDEKVVDSLIEDLKESIKKPEHFIVVNYPIDICEISVDGDVDVVKVAMGD